SYLLLTLPPLPRSTLFPYTTLFRSWNGRDAILKERLFGLTNSEGNHGEDVKECYYYLDATPTGSYLKMLYKYPQRAFPYAELVEDRKSTRLNSSHDQISYAVFCLKK